MPATRTPHLKAILALMSALILAASSALAQAPPGSEPPAWSVCVGGGIIHTPTLLGSKETMNLGTPEVIISYKHFFSASAEDGLRFYVVDRGGFFAGPMAKVSFPRYENGHVPLRIGGTDTKALQGLGDVNATAELGGFAGFYRHGVGLKGDVRKGVNGHNGLIGTVDGGFRGDIHSLFYRQGPPIFLTAGPRATLVDSNYNQAYFGVTAAQSSRSGLSQYSPKGGLLSYGAGGALVLPLSRTLAATVFGDYERLTGDARNAPLVQNRGSAEQGTVGVVLTYSFGFGKGKGRQ